MKKDNSPKLPHTTPKHKEILHYLYQFRFLHTNQFQKLLNHKNPKRIQIWLKELKDNGYIKTNYNPKSFLDKNKPAIYYLTPQSIQILKMHDDCYEKALTKIYTEKKRKKKFINHSLDIADIYLFLLSQKEKDEEISFFTENELVPFDYFPDPLPSAYIEVQSKTDTQRYFLEVFDEYTPAFVLRNRVKMYMKYIDNGEWEAHAEGAEFPSILFVCPTNSLKKHIVFYTRALFEKEYEEKIDLFLTTNEIIRSGRKDIWESVDIMGT